MLSGPDPLDCKMYTCTHFHCVECSSAPLDEILEHPWFAMI